MNDHIDLDLIAAFREGLLDPPTAERIRRHLDGCATCAQREAALDEVTTHLAGAPTPPVPPTVASRLDAALAGEIAAARKASQPAAGQPAAGSAPASPAAAGLPAAAAEEAPATRPHSRRFGAKRGPGRSDVSGPGTGRPSTRGTRTRRTAALLRPLTAVAAVCLLAVGGYLLLRSQGAGTSSSAARPAERAPASGPAFSQRGPIAGPQNSGIGASVLPVRSGTSYQPGTLREDANKVLQRYESTLPSPGHVGSSPMRAFGMSQMSGCLQRVSNGRRPLIADSATYAGRPATVIIAPANSTARGHVWVVGPACSATASDIISQSGL